MTSLRPRPPQRESLTIVLPLPPNRANQRVHWRVQRKGEHEWRARAFVELYRHAGPARYNRNKKQCWSVTATLYVWSTMDDDNAVARLKLVLDLLVGHGLLYNDKRPWCRLSGIPEQVIDRKSQRVELTLTPLPDGEVR